MDRTDGSRRQRKNTPLTKGEKWLLGAGLVLVGLFFTYAISSYILDLDPKVSIPPPAPIPSPNALDYYIQGRSLLTKQIIVGNGKTARTIDLDRIRKNISKRFLVQSPSNWPDKTLTLADMQALTAKNSAVFPIVQQALNTEYRNPTIRSYQSSTEFPYYSLRDITTLLVIDGDTKCLSGDMTGGAERYLDAIHMGVDVPRGGTIVIAQIGRSAQSQGRTGLWSFHDKLSGSQARRAARRLETIVSRQVPVVEVLQEEKWYGQARLLEWFQEPGWRNGLGNRWSLSSLRAAISLQLTSKRTVMRNYTRCLDAIIANTKLPYALQKEIPNSGDFISNDYANSARYTPLYFRRNDTMNALLIVSLALHAYRADHGQYPASLKELVPAYLRAIPNDPFAVQGPLLYKRANKSYVLYSVGPDGTDNGGQACLGRDLQNGKWVMISASIGGVGKNVTGDIVAGVTLP